MGTEDNSQRAPEELGVVPRCIERIFGRIADRDGIEEGVEVLVRMSFLEIYRERVKDLLHPDDTPKERPITIRQDTNGRIIILGNEEKEMQSAEEARSHRRPVTP